MTLTTGLNIAKSALATVSAQTEVVSRNIAGAGEAGYVHRSAYPVSLEYGGAYLPQVTRDQNQLLFSRVLTVSGSQAGTSSLASGLDQLEAIYGDPQFGLSPVAAIEELGSALQLFAEAPHDPALAATAVARAADVADGLNAASATVQQVRAQADADMSASVARINDLLTQFEEVNTAITTLRTEDPLRNDYFDSRDRILNQLSQEIGIKTASRDNDDMVIYTDSGVTLFEKVARDVSFQPTSIYEPATVGSTVYVDGVAVTGQTSVMPIADGRLAGLATLRDDIAPQVQDHLDEIARGMIEVFAETDQSAVPALPAAAGLFTYSGAPAVPVSGTLVTGLAADISINVSVDPAQGGDVMRLRDGAISDPGNPAYLYNQTGADGYTARLRELSEALEQPRAFDPATGLRDMASVGGFAGDAVGWLGQTRTQAHARAEYQTVLKERSELALSHRTGVNIDEEMTRLLELERSYQASARLITAVDQMYAALFAAV